MASRVGEANTDAGTVRSPGRRGNAQLSEIRYARRLAAGRTLTLGMLETAAWFDTAATAAWLHVECALKFGPGLISEDLCEQLPAVFRDLGLR